MNTAVLGAGTIGGGVVNILLGGVRGITLTKILDRKEKFDPARKELYTDNLEEILSDDKIDAVVETIGGRGFALEAVKGALERGKHVVTANKELIAYHLPELMRAAEKSGAYLQFEAAVGGGIPIMKTLSEIAEFNEITEIGGILNGTTNFILTKMQNEGMDFSVALKEAQKLGFAEADPSADLSGGDMVRKISILAMLAFKREVSPDDVYSFPLTGLTKNFIDYIAGMGLTLKYICRAKFSNGKIDVCVEPRLVKNGSLMSGVNYETNIVSLDSRPNGELSFIGKGAGRYPTAAAIIADLAVIRDGGQRMKFENEGKAQIGTAEEKVDAVVMRGGEIATVRGADVSSIRNGGFDFYGILY